MTEKRIRRPMILLMVLVAHIVIVVLALRADRHKKYPTLSVEPLVLLILPGRQKSPIVRVLPEPPAPLPIPRPTLSLQRPEINQGNAVTAAPGVWPPLVDWDKEAEIASKNAMTNSEMQNAYRDLSALSPAQLDWIRENHLEPAAPGIQWKYRRVEVTQGGLPIIHINDRCVAVPLLMMMVLCNIGHIEPNGNLLDHMRDPH